MTSVNISLKKEAYEFLKSKKASGESFSDLILSLKNTRKNTMKFFGIWKGMPDEKFDQIAKRLKESRKEINTYFARRLQ